MSPPHSAEARGGFPERILFPPMLFPRNALVSGPQACFFAEKTIAKVKMGKSSPLLPTGIIFYKIILGW
jgi:hypothetical protein